MKESDLRTCRTGQYGFRRTARYFFRAGGNPFSVQPFLYGMVYGRFCTVFKVKIIENTDKFSYTIQKGLKNTKYF